ncbi:hypothetical protein LZP73_07540 [Shewanella sp. AS16]|uniref:hypothetical protein n=1 Tax=Shewanella sp. AS16 TaxID=2907625 RepID=UPI001F38FFB3|nr:hypothetical protein [Shewanella sp. AS16]MCE9686068.1 hypothetical protein [Shewanella sp. AS16]
MKKSMEKPVGKILSVLLMSLMTLGVAATERPSLQQIADKARQDSLSLEQQQLAKAKQAAEETQAREAKIQARQRGDGWEAEQQQKARRQFETRADREQKYLQQAREAAAKDRKIPEPKAILEPKTR